jgi:IS1 family transposase
MNQLSTRERAAIVSVLVEGNSLRATARITGFARMTIEKLLRDLGLACLAHHDVYVRDLKSVRVQCDEIWCFVGAKEKNATEEQKAQGWGDIWTWTGMDADSKLMISWFVGDRGQVSANTFMSDVAGRLTQRVQLTTDGNAVYLVAVDRALSVDVDYGQVQKIYTGQGGGRYSPAMFVGAKRAVVTGDPDRRHISTSYVERQNLTMRMHMRRFTRLTNGFSKKVENHAMAVALHFTYYNFCKVHQSLRVTPAMEAGLSDHVWSLEELVSLLEQADRVSA